MTNIDRYDNYFKDGDYLIYTCTRTNYILQIINVNIGSEDMDIRSADSINVFRNRVFTKYGADIPYVYKVIKLYK